MIPAPALRKQCPYCGGVKELSNIASGNTFWGKTWSDTRTFFPMLPQNYPIQKCPHCGKYYFLEDAKDFKEKMGPTPKEGNRLSIWCKRLFAKDKIKLDEDTQTGKSEHYCGETGDLSFSEAKEAFYQLYEEASDERKFLIRLIVVFAYNDGVREHCIYSVVKDRQFFIENCLAMTEMPQTEGTLKAELFREAGMFKECIETIARLEPASEYENSVRKRIREKARLNDSVVFLLSEE